MPYTIIKLSERLYFIRWMADATDEEATRFIAEMTLFLDQAENPLYFISDLTRGCITQLDVLRRLADLTTHRNWSGSTSFASISSSVFSNLFARLASTRQKDDRTFTNLHDALDYLEELAPGITDRIDWDDLLRE
jgi:hypothetical protein